MKLFAVAIAVALLAAGCASSEGEAASDANSGSTTTTAAPPVTTTTEPATTTTAAPTTTVPPCGSGGDLALGQQDRTITTADGLEREFLLFLPASYEEGTRADVVFNFHGRGSNAIQQHLYGFFVPLAEEDNVILVNPEALETGGGAVQWNGRVGTDDDRILEPADDVDFVDELIVHLQSEYCIGDLYASGMSSGGFMSAALGCWEDSPFVGIAPVTLAVHTPGCDAAPSATFVYFHGTSDGTVPFDGNGGSLDSAPVTAQEWADHNGCDPERSEESVSEEVVHFSWTGCDATTDFYVIEGGGHTWPGSIEVPGLGYVTPDISASEIIWDAFFG